MHLRFASTFISHASEQDEFARALGSELSRRGVLTWLYKDELAPGGNLDEDLRAALEGQLSTTVLLSDEYMAKSWCLEELRWSLQLTRDEELERTLPVFLGEPRRLIGRSSLLRRRWLKPDGSEVRRLGVRADGPDVSVAEVARHAAAAQYRDLRTRESSHLVVVLDQRGRGKGVGVPDLPESWQAQPWPALVFRPDLEERTAGRVSWGEDWSSLRDTMVQALGDALETRREREVYVTGHAQLALSWLLGSVFDRSSSVSLTAYNPGRGGQFCTLDLNEPRFQSPPGGASTADVTWRGEAPDATTREVSVYLGPEPFEPFVEAHRSAVGDTTPLAVRIVPHVEGPEDVVALAGWLAAASAGRATRVYTALPFHALPLLSALLKHATGKVTFMEWDAGERTYRECPMVG